MHCFGLLLTPATNISNYHFFTSVEFTAMLLLTIMTWRGLQDVWFTCLWHSKYCKNTCTRDWNGTNGVLYEIKLFKAVLSWSCIFQIPLTQALTTTITQMTMNLHRHFADAESKEGSKKTHVLYVKNYWCLLDLNVMELHYTERRQPFQQPIPSHKTVK